MSHVAKRDLGIPVHGSQQRAMSSAQTLPSSQHREDEKPAEPVPVKSADSPGLFARQDPIRQLKKDAYDAQTSYLASLRKSGVLDAGKAVPKVRNELSQLHQTYVSMMMLQCMKPLKEGVSPDSVLTAVSMGTMMYMLSPNFRTQVGNSAASVADSLGARIDGREARESKLEAKGEKGVAKAGTAGKESLSGKWRRRVDRMEHMERGYRDPFTEHSAALTHVGLAESAYDRMRVSGMTADGRQEVANRYEESVRMLYDYASDDGLDKSDVELHVRLLIGQRMDSEPGFASTFAEIGNGRYARSAPQDMAVVGTGSSVSAWAGGFEDSFDGNKVLSGTFGLRQPQLGDEHRLEMARSMLGEMSSVSESEDLGTVLGQHLVGSVTRTSPGLVEHVADRGARTRMARSRAMFSSMADDGIDQQDQKLLYMGAYIDAVQQLSDQNPGRTAEWAQQFGPDWKAGVMSTMEDYAAMSDQGESVARGFGSARREDTIAPQDPYSAAAKDHGRSPRGTAIAESSEHLEDSAVQDDEPQMGG